MKYLSALPALILCTTLAALSSGCPEQPPVSDAAGGRDAGLADVNTDAALIDAAGADRERPDSTQPDAAQPDVAQADAAQPDAAQADAAQADAAQADAVQADAARADAAQPDVGTSPFIQVSSPNGGERLPVGFEVPVTWTSANLADTVFLYYSKDLFTSDINLIAADRPDNGSYTWTVPDDLSDSVRVKVAASLAQDTVFDFSDMPFEIVEASITVTSPNGGEVLPPFGSFEITWTSEHVLGDVKIELSRDDFVADVTEIVAATANDGAYTWDPVEAARSDSAKIRISAVRNPAVFDTSDAGWSFGPWIQVTSPNGGEELSVGAQCDITWSSSQDQGLVQLYYSTDNFVSHERVIGRDIPDTGSFRWDQVPDVVSSTVRVRAAFESDPSLYDISDADLTIRAGGWARTYPVPSPSAVIPLGLDSEDHVFMATSASDGGECALRELSSAGGTYGYWSFGSSGTRITDLAVDSDDSVYLVGTCSDTCDLDPGPGTRLVTIGSAPSSFLLKLDAQGDLSWARVFADLHHGGRIAVFGNSAVAIAGDYLGAPDLDPAPNSGALPLAVNQSGFVASFAAADGAFAWAQTWGGDATVAAHTVTHDSGGNVFVGGTFLGREVDFNPGPGEILFEQVGESTAWAIRYTSTGVFTTLRAFGGTRSNQVHAILLDESDGIYLVGSYGGTPGEQVDIDTRTTSAYYLNATGNSDAFVAKYDPSFFVESALTFGASDHEWFFAAARCDTGELRLFGRSESTDLDLDPGAAELIPPGMSHFLVSLGPDLSWSAARHWGYGIVDVTDIVCDSVGHTYVSGAANLTSSELAPVHAPCFAESTTIESMSDYLIKFMPDLCW